MSAVTACGGRARVRACHATRAEREHPMLDIIVLVITAVFFALSVGYAYACERL
jgi:hypothetical protein